MCYPLGSTLHRLNSFCLRIMFFLQVRSGSSSCCYDGETKHRDIRGENPQKSNGLWITPLTCKILDRRPLDIGLRGTGGA